MSEKKAEFRTNSVRKLSFCEGLRSSDPEEQLKSMREIRNFLSGDNCCSNIGLVVDFGIVPQIVQYVICHDNPPLQFEATWAITNIAGGSSAETSAVVTAGAIPALIEILSVVNDERVTEQAAWALANIAGDAPNLQQQVITDGAVKALIGWLSKPDLSDSSLKIGVWTIANLCRSDLSQPPPPINEVKLFIPILAQLAKYPDPEVLKKSCWALYYMTRQRKTTDVIEEMVQAGIVPCLAQLLDHIDQDVVTGALSVLINITAGDDAQTQAVIDTGVLESLGSLLYYPSEKVQASAGWVLANILGGNTAQVQAVIDSKLLEPILQVLEMGDLCVQQQLKSAIVNLLSRGTMEQIEFAESRGLISILRKVLTSDEYDQVVRRENKKPSPEVIEDDIEQLRKQIRHLGPAI